MRKRDWLLIAIDSYIEPIQIQKTLFKFAQEGGAPVTERYRFVPYNWGPCSMQIYSDLQQLREEGLVEFVPTGRGWSAYRLTDAGERAASKLREKANPRLLQQLEDKRQWVKTRRFHELLKDVYADYPDFASKSLFEA